MKYINIFYYQYPKFFSESSYGALLLKSSQGSFDNYFMIYIMYS